MINNEPIKQVASYKYLGLLSILYIDNKLSWEVNVDNMCRRVQQKITFYRGSALWSCSEGLFHHAYVLIPSYYIV